SVCNFYRSAGRLCIWGTGFRNSIGETLERSSRITNTERLPESPASSSAAALRGPLSREVHLWVSRVVFLFLFRGVRGRSPGSRVVRIFVPFFLIRRNQGALRALRLKGRNPHCSERCTAGLSIRLHEIVAAKHLYIVPEFFRNSR